MTRNVHRSGANANKLGRGARPFFPFARDAFAGLVPASFRRGERGVGKRKNE